MTEDEAKIGPCVHKIGADCIASDCRAWKWLEPHVEFLELEIANHSPVGSGWNNMTISETYKEGRIKSAWWRIKKNRTGYCGLAGKP